jgi:DNA-binding GntR family transcriptional regulator
VAEEVAAVGVEAASEELMARFFRSDWQFHQLVFDATRNPFLEEMSEIITTRVHRMRQIVEGGGDDTDRAVQEHRAVLDALAEDPASAVAAMRHHIDAVRLRSRADASHTA